MTRVIATYVKTEVYDIPPYVNMADVDKITVEFNTMEIRMKDGSVVNVHPSVRTGTNDQPTHVYIQH